MTTCATLGLMQGVHIPALVLWLLSTFAGIGFVEMIKRWLP